MKLPHAEIAARIEQLPGWKLDKDALIREFTFPGFPDAIAFVTRLGFDAEAADHHPDLHVRYKRVSVRWSTHSEGGVTEKDFDGITKTDAVAAKFHGR